MKIIRAAIFSLLIILLLCCVSCSAADQTEDAVETPGINPSPDPEIAKDEDSGDYVIVIDLSEQIGIPGYISTGFLHGLSEDCSKPGPDYFDILKPQSFRGANLGGYWLDGDVEDNLQMLKVYHDYLNPLGVTIDYLLMDVWGFWYGHSFMNRSIRFPGDNDEWDDYEEFCTVIATFVVENDMKDFQYNLWNEPNLVRWGTSQFWPRPREQFYEMWMRGYRVIKSIHPDAVISGPDYAPYSQEMDWRKDVEEFFDFCVENDVVPQVFTLHALPGDPVEFKAFGDKVLTDRGISGVSLYINEYSEMSEQHPGAAAWYITRLERAQVRGGRAIWPRPNTIFRAPIWNISGELNGLMFLDQEFTLSPTGIWWVYMRYAEITGNFVRTIASEHDYIDAVAGIDAGDQKLRILLGANNIDEVGNIAIIIKEFAAASYLSNNGSVNVKIEKIPFNEGNPVAAPEVIKDESVTLIDGELKLVIHWTDVHAAYAVVVG